MSRAGTTQHDRARAELAATHFLPDERDLADLIVFGQNLATKLRYFDSRSEEETETPNWSAFFRADLTASLAALAKLPVALFRATQADLSRWLKADSKRDPRQLAAHALLAFHLPIALLKQAAQHHQGLPADHPLHKRIAELFAAELASPLQGLVSWYKGALDSDLGVGNEIFGDVGVHEADYPPHPQAMAGGLHLPAAVHAALRWGKPLSATDLSATVFVRAISGSWSDFYGAIAADPAPYRDAIGQPRQRYEQIYDALTYNLLNAAIEQIYFALERIRRDAAGHLQDALSHNATHAPHHGLWLAFLELFQHARSELNAFGARHLDFHFREVLRLLPRQPQPNQVHVLFELARGHNTQLLRAGTLLRAGKDALGKPLTYALDDEFVVSRAEIVALRGIRKIAMDTRAQGDVRVLAATEVRSRDGLGQIGLAHDDPSWSAFGAVETPPARIGFAISDRKLFLREGSRTIKLLIEFDRPLSRGNTLPRWIVRLSSADGWFEVRSDAQITTTLAASQQQLPLQLPIGTLIAPRALPLPLSPSLIRPAPQKRVFPAPATALEITLKLNPEDPAIMPLDAEIHGSDHLPGLPAAEFILDWDSSASPAAFTMLRELQLRTLNLSVHAAGLKQLMVVGGDAVVDTSSTFPPFGTRPDAGATWIIGSSEIFSKPIESWTLGIDWVKPYDENSYFYKRRASAYDPDQAVLRGGKWVSANSSLPVVISTPLPFPAKTTVKPSATFTPTFFKNEFIQPRQFGGTSRIRLGDTNVNIELQGAKLIDASCAQTLDNPLFSAESVNGFVRLRLPKDFGHQAFAAENTRALIAKAQRSVFTPTAGVNISGEKLPLTPYDPLLSRLEAAYTTTTDAVTRFSLLHPFGVVARDEIKGHLLPQLPYAGELLIGIEHFQSPARLSLLVQVADGSADPLRQAPTLQFHYLHNDEWRPFAVQDIDDRTRNFSTSGVLGLKLPEAANRTHRMLPTDLHWIRIAAVGELAAFNRLLSVDAHAARASFIDADNDPAFLSTALAPGSIARLAEGLPAISKIRQPYASFGGRPIEDENAFNTRVSERLRHKDRATTLWDYETLVLGAFPHLYRVKCLETTRLLRNAQGVAGGNHEMKPGAVTVLAVPRTHDSRSHNPLRPYTDQATLTAVEAFLRQRISPFVQLEVHNPQFEEVQADFKVKFQPQVSDIAFHIDELNRALVGFLSPWAHPDGGDIRFGGHLWKSALIDFVEAQPLVDYVTDFRLYHRSESSAGSVESIPTDLERVEASSPRAILVSAPKHLIHELPGHG